MPAQPDSALKLWKSASAQPVASTCPVISGFWVVRLGKKVFLAAQWAQMWGSHCWPQPRRSAERALRCKQFLCFRFPMGVKPCWAYNACHCTLPEAGSLGWREPNFVVMKGFIHQRAKPLDEPVYLVARKGTLSRELIQKRKSSHGSSAGYA